MDPDNAWSALKGMRSLGPPTLAHGGALWTPVTMPPQFGRGDGVPLGPDAFLGIFGDGPRCRHAGTAERLSGQLGGTPLMATWVRRGAYGERMTEIDVGMDPERAGTIVAEERDRTRAALARFFAGELRFGETRVYRRVHPMAYRLDAVTSPYVAHTTTMSREGIMPVPIRADLHAVAGRFWTNGSHPYEAERHPPGLYPTAFCDDGDLDMLANLAPGFVMASIRSGATVRNAYRQGPPVDPDPIVAPLVAWERRGRIGAVLDGDRETALRAVVDACDAFARARPDVEVGGWGGLAKLRRYVVEIALPRVWGPLPEDDLDAMAGLSP
jgi:hypothetical protein